jgi:signal peptidase I
VYVDGKLQPEPYLPLSWRSGNFAPYTVPAGDVWVLGDHRAVSLDSRCYGPIALSRIVGRVMLIWWPFNKAQWLGW